jgi:hypothetical protein
MPTSNPPPWRWEIRRHSKPMGIKLGTSGYPTQIAAEQAGKRALAQLLQDIMREEREQHRK